MPKKCCFASCRIEQDDPIGRHESFFKIASNEKEKQKWLDNISTKITGKLTKNSYVCSLHFEKNSYNYTESNVIRIKKGCYPTIFTDIKSRKQDVFLHCAENTETDGSSCNMYDIQDDVEFCNDLTIEVLSEKVAKDIPDETKTNVLEKNNFFENRDVDLLKQNDECSQTVLPMITCQKRMKITVM